MESNGMQVTLQLGLESSTLDDAIREARKAAEGIADACEATIVRTTVLHWPSGSGEPIFFDTDEV
jgi:hypothetical protein